MDHYSENPAPLLVKFLPMFPKGDALDVACGYGRNALYLAAQGYSVTGFDRDEAAVSFCNETALKRQLAFSAQCVDLEKETPFKSDAYALLTCFYYLDRQSIPRMKEALRVGGMLVYETFLIDQHQIYKKPSRAAFCWKHNELLRLFENFRVRHYYEGQIDASGQATSTEGRWVVQLIAERLRESR